jgi:hypothetical protein
MRRDFELQEATISDSRYLNGLNIVVEAPEAGSMNIGTPVCSAVWKSVRSPACIWQPL